ncbi:MAG: radical SAM protein [Paludibacteraceae bacterium]|nr:radical SAM protein [Paludibacteraceae bacterium]
MKRINEIFESLQGEGFHTGTAAVFVRFSGCNLRCPFCDTQHETYIEMGEEDIAHEVSQYKAPWVILTGGEPSLQATETLVDRFHALGKRVAMETNGTHAIPTNLDWLTLSPKEGKDPVLTQADEVKVVYQAGVDVERWCREIRADHYFLQPCSCRNTQEVVRYILEHPYWRLSLQTHKYIGIE